MSTVISKGHRFRGSSGHGQSLGLSSSAVGNMAKQVEAGFSFSALEKFLKASGLPLGMVAEILRIPTRTLVRRRAAGKFDFDESERLLRFATVFEKAVDLFEGDIDAARNWLMTPKRALGGEAPLPFSRTEIGAREVEALIGRLEHGVFS